jgi:hypothetical protein
MDAADAQDEIRDLLWEWDFIGVKGARAAAADEYDCLMGPLYRRLVHGADSEAIGSYLRSELPSHFGLEPTPSLGIFVDKLMAWWSDEARAGKASARGRDEPSSGLEAFEKAEDEYWLAGYVASEKLPAIAVAGLMGGLDSPSLRVLAGQPPQAATENAQLWQQSLTELSRSLAQVDPFQRTAARLLESILARRLEACRGAHRAYWLGTDELDRSDVSMDDAPPLVRDLVGFIDLADECERHVLNDRDDIRDDILKRARQILDRLEADAD